jgi:glycosyltransferase involved in cell wall biosynthesis
MSRPPTLAYLCSFYARLSHSFIRGEVARLRALGHTVHTFSIRPIDPGELVSEEVRHADAATETILKVNPLRLLAAAAREAFGAPGRFLAAVRLTAKTGMPGGRGRLWSVFYLFEACYLAGRLRALGVEHLHVHFADGASTVAMLASILSGVPFSLTIHGPSEFDKPEALALGEKVKRSRFTVAVCDFGRSQLFRWADHADWPKVRVVRCGLDARYLGRAPGPVPESARLVCVGRLSEQKGQLLLVEAAGRLAAEGRRFEVVLIGDGPMRGPIERLVDRLGLRDRVLLTGWLGNEQVREEIERSRAMVLPSFAEGLPVVLMEALALGRPVVSTYIAGIPELVRPGGCGWLVPAGSVDALAAAMRAVLDATPGDLARMGAAGAALVSERHDVAAEVRKLSALFQGAPGATGSVPGTRAGRPGPSDTGSGDGTRGTPGGRLEIETPATLGAEHR